MIQAEEKKTALYKIREEYDRHFRTCPIRDEDAGYAWIAKQIVSRQPDLRSLADIACGGGYFLNILSRETRGARLTGTDISAEALKIARKGERNAWVLSSSEELALRSHSFDAVTCLGSLEHFLDIDKALSEMRRIASKDAYFYILVPNIFWYKDLLAVCFTGSRVPRNQTQERFMSLGEWKTLFENNGFRVADTEKYNGLAKNPGKQKLKDLLIPLRFSYHFLFILRLKEAK